MFTLARILRNDAEGIRPRPPPLSMRDEARRDRILAVGRALMARHGRHTIRMAEFAIGLGYCVSSIRRHFPDLDALLSQILQDHLRHVSRTMGEVPHDAPDRKAALRAAYLEATRTPLGGFTEGHLLLVRDRHLLPEDERTPIEATREVIGQIMTDGPACEILALLDGPCFVPAQIEAMLTALAPAPPLPRKAREPHPVPPPRLPASLRPRILVPPPTRQDASEGQAPERSASALRACVPAGAS